MIACTGSACPKKIKTSSLIVHSNYTAQSGISEGGKIIWVSDTANPQPFVIHIYGPNPCVGANPNIPGSLGSPAICVLASGTDGAYLYAVLAPGQNPSAPGVTKVTFHTDSCKVCQINIARKKQAKHPLLPVSIAPSNPPIVPIYCDDGGTAAAAIPSSLQVYSKQLVLWTQVGRDSTTDWSAAFKDAVCNEGNAFGTIDRSAPLGCTVSDNATVGQTYSYAITYQSSDPQKTCTGTASLTIIAAPQAQ